VGSKGKRAKLLGRPARVVYSDNKLRWVRWDCSTTNESCEIKKSKMLTLMRSYGTAKARPHIVIGR